MSFDRDCRFGVVDSISNLFVLVINNGQVLITGHSSFHGPDCACSYILILQTRNRWGFFHVNRLNLVVKLQISFVNRSLLLFGFKCFGKALHLAPTAPCRWSARPLGGWRAPAATYRRCTVLFWKERLLSFYFLEAGVVHHLVFVKVKGLGHVWLVEHRFVLTFQGPSWVHTRQFALLLSQAQGKNHFCV